MTERAYSKNMIKGKSLKVGIVSFPWASQVPYVFLSDLAKILNVFCQNTIIISGDSANIHVESSEIELVDIGLRQHYVKNISPFFYSASLWILKCILIQLIMSLKIIELNKEFDIVIFYMAYPYYLLPLVVSKTLKKKTVEVITRSKSTSLTSKVLRLQDYCLYYLLDGISPESEILITNLNLKKYKNKLLPTGSRFIDTSIFIFLSNYELRDNTIGFVGRLTEEKGIMNLIRAIPHILSKNDKMKILIIGDGDQRIKIEQFVKENGFQDNVKMLGWVTHKELPKYLHEMKLLVLPSYSEGLPTIILEAMACGTPVLATRVGAIPDLIINNNTGFIMESNSSECIALNVVRALGRTDVTEIIKNANYLIENKFTFKAAVNRWKCMLANL